MALTAGVDDSGDGQGAAWVDFDLDGDQDIILSALTYSFTPVPPALSNAWNETKADLLFLENTYYKQVVKFTQALKDVSLVFQIHYSPDYHHTLNL